MPSRLQSNSTRLISETNDTPIDLDETLNADITEIRREDDDDAIDLDAIPSMAETVVSREGKRQREIQGDSEVEFLPTDIGSAEPIDIDSDMESHPPKRSRKRVITEDDDDDDDDKKKMAMDLSYEGFAIYGRILCLVVKRREMQQATHSVRTSRSKTAGQGHATMENWITSTQLPANGEDGDAP
jgi:hypothetical protein